MREEHDVLHGQQRVRHLRFLLEHVEASARYLSGLKGLDQGGFVDDVAAGGVDQVGVRASSIAGGLH